MADLEPFLEAPFEDVSNRSFRTILLVGIALFGLVAAVGRSDLTVALVLCYVASLPLYVGYRVRVRDSDRANDSDGVSDSDSVSDSDGVSDSNGVSGSDE